MASRAVDSAYRYARLLTREVAIGEIIVGGKNPIRIQSMTNTDTGDTEATVQQVLSLARAGCEIVRLATPSIKDAENLAVIRKTLHHEGCQVPLVADVHFSPEVAEAAARIVEKVRINPGNYADRKTRQDVAWSEREYALELERIAGRVHPLLRICKQYGTALRIGVNHGSLSGRIISRYGDTPEGMAQSAMEFIRICEDMGFYDLIVSLKASNIKVTTYATRLLVSLMQDRGKPYPIHLGVTEAGDGEDGRIKSAAGIGALLEDGIGDTIRVSLTENPVHEIPVAKILADRYNERKASWKERLAIPPKLAYFSYEKRQTIGVGRIGAGKVPAVVTSCSGIASFECTYFSRVDFKPEYIYNPPDILTLKHPGDIMEIVHFMQWDPESRAFLPLWDAFNYLRSRVHSPVTNFVMTDEQTLTSALIERIKNDPTAVLVFESHYREPVLGIRQLFARLEEAGCRAPVMLNRIYGPLDIDLFAVYAATDLASLLVDGLGDGIWVEADKESICKFPTSTVFAVLQATGDRITRTEYIACPSCARTQFDIQKVLQKVRERTSGLDGLKIAVMGCVVNGPGEMADAHFGYVGAGKGKVHIYKGREIVRRNVAEEMAVDVLLDLIKTSGDWSADKGYHL